MTPRRAGAPASGGEAAARPPPTVHNDELRAFVRMACKGKIGADKEELICAILVEEGTTSLTLNMGSLCAFTRRLERSPHSRQGS